MSKEPTACATTNEGRPIGLTGRYDRALDGKKRITIPSAWREALGPDCVYVMPDTQNGCLQLIPKAVMESRLEDLRKAPLSDTVLNQMLQVIGESSELLEFDVQGRIRVSDRLLKYAHITRDVVLKGAFRLATIWCASSCAPEADVDVKKLREAMGKLKF